MGHEKSSVVRVSVFSQVFYLMAPLIEGQGVLRLPVQEQQKWTPVDLNDILEGFIRLCKEQKPRGAAFGSFKPVGGKDVYQFTPKEVIRMTELTKEINQGLGSSEEIRFEMCSPEETRNWMKQMRDDSRFKDRPEGKGQDSHRDRPFTFPLGRYLNDDMIDTILEIWQLANEGEMDITTPDLSQILGRDPQGIRQYFKSNRQQFRDLK
ncbi:hypothetical protein DM01DRAFT_1331422 [Hesseltinella vesiculosa]|uniref:Uncharacterized protein n=1 Tax=Hesseltinella vesiculosa TaxID=101127 RepID=A0A1X2GV85_9FUNG|nr:hypothetical protein DM01DRAFT_1331422 [Hesseltinella vesiculosa]